LPIIPSFYDFINKLSYQFARCDWQIPQVTEEAGTALVGIEAFTTKCVYETILNPYARTGSCIAVESFLHGDEAAVGLR
jgi:hypothetical protein